MLLDEEKRNNYYLIIWEWVEKPKKGRSSYLKLLEYGKSKKWFRDYRYITKNDEDSFNKFVKFFNDICK